MSCVEQGRAWTTPILQDIADFRQQFEQFVQEAKESTEGKMNEHRLFMQTNDETVAQLKKKEKVLRGEASKLQKEQDQERSEIQELTFKVKQLQEKESLVPQQVEANRKQAQRELAICDRLAQDVADLEKQRKHKLEELRRGATFYSERLGLKFERLVDVSGHHLRFCFVHIDRADPLREFGFDVEIKGELYSVSECEPALSSLPTLVAELNASNDLGAFVRQVRKAFRQSTIAA